MVGLPLAAGGGMLLRGKGPPAPLMAVAAPSTPVVQASRDVPGPVTEVRVTPAAGGQRAGMQPVEQVVILPPPATANVPMAAASAPTFDGRPLRKVRTLAMQVTAYSPDARSCGKSADNITASGYSVWTNGMKLAAADTRVLPFGSIVTVPGYNGGRPIPILDRGGAIKGLRLDVLYPTHELALQWGRQDLEVTVWEYAD